MMDEKITKNIRVKKPNLDRASFSVMLFILVIIPSLNSFTYKCQRLQRGYRQF